MKKLLQLIVINGFIFISACAWLDPKETVTAVDLERMRHNIELQQWQLQGKIGLRHNDKADSAYINWRQSADQWTVRLSTVLGQTIALIEGSAQQTFLQIGQDTFQAVDSETLLYQLTGWQLPMTPLAYWIRGLPDPQMPYTMSNDGRSFTQSGWQVAYRAVMAVKQRTLPARIHLQRPPFTVVLIIQNWTL